MLALGGCYDGLEDPRALGSAPRTQAEVVPPGSCEGSCGYKSDEECWCDDYCETMGDCCADFVYWCVPPPPEWSCDEIHWNTEDGCDCGCGAFDPDCADESADVCQFCAEEGACSSSCADIDPNDNTGCTADHVPEEWTCSGSFYGTSDGCDCGCGVLDPDCEDATAGACDYCMVSGACSSSCDELDPDNNAECA